METKGSEAGLDSKEPSFSSYCSNTLAETAARVSMEESSEQHHLDYDFEFGSLLESDNNVFPVFNGTALDKHDKQVEAITKDIISPPSLDAKKPEGVYKKSNSIGSSSRRWSFTRLLRRNNSELEAPTRTSNNTKEEEKEGEQLGCDGFIHYMCPPILPANPKSSSTDSDGSNKRVFPLPEIVPLDKSQHDEHGKSTSSDVEKPEGLKYKKSKSTGNLSKGWSFKGLLRRSSSERGTPRSANNTTEDGMENTSVLSRCFSLPSRSSSKVSTNLEKGEKLGSDGCMFYLCPIISLPTAGCTQPPKVVDQVKVAVKEKKPSSKCSTDSDHESKNNNSADLSKVDGFSKRPKLQNNPHKMYLKKKTSESPYMQEAIGFFAMVRPLAMLFTSSASV